MHEFKDSKGRTWPISVTVASVKRVKEHTGYDLLNVKDRFQQLATDPILLCDVLCSLCRPAMDEQEITDEEFGEGLAGDAIDAATRALLEDLADFFPNPVHRAAIRKVITAMDEVMAAGMDLVTARMDAAIPKRKAETLAKIDSILGNMFTDSPESSELTPALTPSVS